MKRNLTLTVLALTTILLIGCAGLESTHSNVKAAPSSKFLFTAASEFKSGENGPACQEIAKDWISTNTPQR